MCLDNRKRFSFDMHRVFGHLCEKRDQKRETNEKREKLDKDVGSESLSNVKPTEPLPTTDHSILIVKLYKIGKSLCRRAQISRNK